MARTRTRTRTYNSYTPSEGSSCSKSDNSNTSEFSSDFCAGRENTPDTETGSENEVAELGLTAADPELVSSLYAEDNGQTRPKAYEELTENAMARMSALWKSFSVANKKADHIDFLIHTKPKDLRVFLRWLLKRPNSRIRSVDTMKIYRLTWRMLYQRHARQAFNHLQDDSLTYINVDLKKEFTLCESTSRKPTANVDDLLMLLCNLWKFSTQSFSNGYSRILLATVILTICCTSCRPGAILEIPGQVEQRDSLKYKDIGLFLVKAKYPDGSIGKRLVMLMYLRLLKGQRNKASPTIYIFQETDGPLVLDVLVYFLAIFLRDNAFESEYIKDAEDFYRYEIPGDWESLPFSFKPEILDTPIFRKTANTQSTEGVSENMISNQMKRLSYDSGCMDPVKFYAFRRGAGEAMDSSLQQIGQRIISDARRNRAMGHRGSNSFSRYYNPQFAPAVQSAFLGLPLDDDLVQLASHVSFRRDPGALAAVKMELEKQVGQDTDLVALSKKTQKLRAKLKKKHRFLRRAQLESPESYRAYKLLCRRLKSGKQRFREQNFRKVWVEHFRSNGTKEINRQARGIMPSSRSQPTPAIYFDEAREALTAILFETPELSQQTPSQLRQRRIQAVKMMIDYAKKPERSQVFRSYMATDSLERGCLSVYPSPGICSMEPKGVDRAHVIDTLPKIKTEECQNSLTTRLHSPKLVKQEEGLDIPIGTSDSLLKIECPIEPAILSVSAPTTDFSASFHSYHVEETFTPIIRPFQCPVCFYSAEEDAMFSSRVFSNKDNLKRHYDRHLASYTEGARITCPYKHCFKEFGRLGWYKNHLAKVHDFSL